MQKDTIIIGSVLVVALAISGVHAHRLGTQLEQANAELAQLREQGGGDKAAQGDGVAGARKSLAQKKEQSAKSKATHSSSSSVRSTAMAPAVAPGGADSASTVPDFRTQANAWMERMKTEDPERYQRMVQSRDERQKAADKALQDQVTSLAQRAQVTTNPVEADLVTQIATTLDKINQLRQDRAAVASLPEEQQQAKEQELRDQTHEAYQTLDNLRQQDRTLQLNNLATTLGVPGASAQALADGVTKIYKDTQYTTGGGGRGGPGGGHGGP